MHDTNEIADLFGPFSSCDVSDALVKLGIHHGGFLPDIKAFSGAGPVDGQQKVVGPATTVQVVRASTKGVNTLPGHPIDLARPGRIMVITAPSDCKNAIWGGLMSAAARSKGLLGVVLNGRCRDISEHRSLKFPVFARALSTLGQHTFTQVAAINEPITISDGAGWDIGINPEDIIVADEDGVVVIPLALVQIVVAKMTVAAEQDARCMEDLIAGRGVKETFSKHRK